MKCLPEKTLRSPAPTLKNRIIRWQEPVISALPGRSIQEGLEKSSLGHSASKSVSSNELLVRDPILNNVNKEKRHTLAHTHTPVCVHCHRHMPTRTHKYPPHTNVQLFICVYANMHTSMPVCTKLVWVHYVNCTILNIR